MQFGKTRSDLRHARFSGFIEQRAGADEPLVIFLKEPPLLGRQAQRIGRFVERLDPREKASGWSGSAMPCLLSTGEISRSIFCRSSFVSEDARLKKTELTF